MKPITLRASLQIIGIVLLTSAMNILVIKASKSEIGLCTFKESFTHATILIESTINQIIQS